MAGAGLEPRIEAIRGFNRFYTQKIGVLQRGLLSSPFSLTEVRVLYELQRRAAPTASELGRDLGLDAGYLSRLLRGLERRGLIGRQPAASDRRRSHLRLTRQGQDVFAGLDARASGEVAGMLKDLSPPEQERLVDALRTVQELLGGPRPPAAPACLLRPPRPGDLGWVVHRHGVLYAQEYGWDAGFEALVASIVAEFVKRQRPSRERCWIAERDGANVGCVFLVQKTRTVAQLRLLLVEPAARGLGIGSRLVDECVGFARQAGYRKLVLWTNDVLHAARRIYAKAGFRPTSRRRHHSFGHDLVAETWALGLQPGGRPRE